MARRGFRAFSRLGPSVDCQNPQGDIQLLTDHATMLGPMRGFGMQAMIHVYCTHGAILRQRSLTSQPAQQNMGVDPAAVRHEQMPNRRMLGQQRLQIDPCAVQSKPRVVVAAAGFKA